MAIENLNDLEKSLKLPEGTLKAAIDNTENVKIEIPALVIRTTEEENTLRTNLKTEFGNAAVEIAIKKAREEHKLEFNGKTMDNLLKAYETKALAEAKIEPVKKIQELESDLGTLRTNVSTLQGQLVEKDNQFKAEKQKYETDNLISSKITGDLVLPKEDVALIFKSKHSVELDETGKRVIKRGDEVLKHPTTLSPLTIDEVMKDFLPAYLKGPGGGAGGEDEPGAGSKTGSMAAFEKEMSKKEIYAGSSAFNQEMNKRIKEKTLVV